MGTSNNKFFEWNSSSSLSTRISIYKFTINEEIKSELQERIIKTCGNVRRNFASIKRGGNAIQKERKKKKRRYTLLSLTEFPSASDCTISGRKREKKKKIPANYRSGNCSNAPLTNRRSREFTHSWRLSAHFRQFLQVSGTDALAA